MCLKLSPAHFKASVSCLRQSSIPPFSPQKLLLGRWSHGSYQIPSSPLSSSSSWAGWGTGKGKWQSSLLHGWVREQSSLCRPISVVLAASLAHSIEQGPSAGLAWGICVDSLKGFMGVLCPEWLSVMGFSRLNFCHIEHGLLPEEGTLMGVPRRRLKHIHLCGVPWIYVDRQTEWYICHAIWSECSLLFLYPTFSLLPLSLHLGRIRLSVRPSPHPISIGEDHQTLT